jgi:hypothetical protein
MKWNTCEDGKTIGTKGSEDGTIVLDDEHADGARITLEAKGASAPFAITCGIYGLMLHTAFFSDRQKADAAFVNMKNELEIMLEMKGDALHQEVTRFVGKW